MMIETERLSIRRINTDDWRALKEIWTDQQRSMYARYDKPTDTDDGAVQKRVQRWAKFAGSTEHMFWGVCLDSLVIGYIALNRRDDGYEVGYCFHSAYHHKGFARESMKAVLEYTHENGITHRFTAGTALDNLPSGRLLERLGFKLIGTENVSFYKDAAGNDEYFKGGIFELVM